MKKAIYLVVGLAVLVGVTLGLLRLLNPGNAAQVSEPVKTAKAPTDTPANTPADTPTNPPADTPAKTPVKPGATQPGVASWDKIQAAVTKGVASEKYREGSKILAKSVPTLRPNSIKLSNYEYYVVVSFVRSLTAEQYKTMQKNGKLAYTALTPQQQIAVSRFAEIYPLSSIQPHKSKSSIRFSEPSQYTRQLEPETVLFLWTAIDEQGSGHMLMAKF